jgi:hypothetical protein
VVARTVGLAVVVALASAALTGCGGDSSDRGASPRQVTVPGYGVTPSATVSGKGGTGATARACRADARTLAQDARDFLAHFETTTAYPADLNFVIVREDLARLRSKGCPPTLTGRALALALTPAQRRAFVADLPTAMARQVRAALESTEG